jgi:EAL domain-containing protein (putative c-di-GMP-specific phosphodiesterase class I)
VLTHDAAFAPAPPRTAAPQQEIGRAQLLERIDAALRDAAEDSRLVAVLMVCVNAADRVFLLTQQQLTRRWSLAVDAVPDLLRKPDFFCRVGEHQFCVVLPGLASPAQALLAAYKITRAIAPCLADEWAEDSARVLAGVACFPEHGDAGERLLRNADAAMQDAAGNEEGIVMFATLAHDEPIDLLPGLRDQVIDALRSDAYRLAYQPQLDLASGRCEGVEALLRCTLANGVPLPPTTLIAAAEREGRLGDLTNRVLNTALLQASAWRSAGVATRVSVNLPPDSLRDHELPSDIARTLEVWDSEPGILTLEIVESSMIHDFAQAADVLRDLKRLGVRLAVDDFGTGYSCLAYLRQLPLDELKIDRAFVCNVERSAGERQLVAAMIDLAHSFGMRAVAEGVEDQGTLELLREMGCDMIQGYVYSRPLEAADFLAFRQR